MVGRAEDLKKQLLQQASEALRALIANPDPDLAAAQQTLERFRHYGSEIDNLWSKASQQIAKHLSNARSVILTSLSETDLHKVGAVCAKYAPVKGWDHAMV
eukprot:SAG31_NODE_1129_length_9755_cov_2.095070_8_plen_101_part_00